ncbi:MAG: sugar phosphate isomerase/epimerase [Clostridiales bacterium]|jgi:sugar phosphate isomerase/epimerase|nr:sugar phosphate isomerase/epimerase [Clostridiales bacterium]
MTIGISSASFFNKDVTEDSFEVMKRLGFDTAEVFLTTFSEYEKSFVDMIDTRRRESGVLAYSVHSLNQQYEPELYNVNPRTFGDAINFYRKLCYAAKTMGARYYTFHGPALLKRTPYRFDYAFLGKRTEELCAIIKEYGAELAYENVHWTYFSLPEYFEKLKKESPSIKACLDIKQAMQSKIPYIEYLKAMGDRLVNVHVCDYDENGGLCVPGRGVFDFVTFFKVLKDFDYDGAVLMELYSKDYDSYDEIVSGREYLLECLEKSK